MTEYVDALGLQNCTYLHSFTIYLSPAFLPSPDDSCESWEFLTISLTRLPPYIRHICIGFSDAPNSSSEADQANLLERNSRLPWAPIDASLSAMRCLEHVTFKLGTTIGSDIGGYTMSPSSRNLIRYLLRNTSERGALRFQEVDDVA